MEEETGGVGRVDPDAQLAVEAAPPAGESGGGVAVPSENPYAPLGEASAPSPAVDEEVQRETLLRTLVRSSAARQAMTRFPDGYTQFPSELKIVILTTGVFGSQTPAPGTNLWLDWVERGQPLLPPNAGDETCGSDVLAAREVVCATARRLQVLGLLEPSKAHDVPEGAEQHDCVICRALRSWGPPGSSLRGVRLGELLGDGAGNN